ncbi:MAG: glutamate-5-semialdehyde dehydrogenase [Candidatus Altiarchaeales archaeon]|nr:glutamate-5-semialdehyde dehydrogenase [Candidatus Altiarchaeales archaeon]MBD3415972.1 glutamate-5-semialdehyde dehydrogenase [Candidatus Altiarchaeales archaeon]
MATTIEKARQARGASLELAKTSADEKDRALLALAKVLWDRKGEILEANARDCEESKDEIGEALYKRLQLNEEKVEAMVEGVKSVVKLKDPVGETTYAIELDIDLELYKITVPIGVIGAIFESRPNVVVDVGALCLKSGNAVMMKGGSEARHTNRMLYGLMKAATEESGMPEGWIQLVESREEVTEMLELDEYISLLVPRGSNEFVKYIKENTRIPVLGHASGVCHVYVDGEADMEKALRIAYDAKCQYPAVCNAMETLLVDERIVGEFLPRIWEEYRKAGVTAKGDEKACKVLGDIQKACDIDWSTEYNDLVVNVRTVNGVDEAIENINRYGSAHTDAIVTEDEYTARKFIDSVDSSSVMWNASTRFSDGYRYGLGAEIGISTNKIHARGPVGMEGLVIHKWILKGDGHIVEDYRKKKFTHRKLKKRWE